MQCRIGSEGGSGNDFNNGSSVAQSPRREGSKSDRSHVAVVECCARLPDFLKAGIHAGFFLHLRSEGSPQPNAFLVETTYSHNAGEVRRGQPARRSARRRPPESSTQGTGEIAGCGLPSGTPRRLFRPAGRANLSRRYDQSTRAAAGVEEYDGVHFMGRFGRLVRSCHGTHRQRLERPCG
jgi:hypothetical protein